MFTQKVIDVYPEVQHLLGTVYVYGRSTLQVR